jgi:hypothetical protein
VLPSHRAEAKQGVGQALPLISKAPRKGLAGHELVQRRPRAAEGFPHEHATTPALVHRPQRLAPRGPQRPTRGSGLGLPPAKIRCRSAMSCPWLASVAVISSRTPAGVRCGSWARSHSSKPHADLQDSVVTYRHSSTDTGSSSHHASSHSSDAAEDSPGVIKRPGRRRASCPRAAAVRPDRRCPRGVRSSRFGPKPGSSCGAARRPATALQGREPRPPVGQRSSRSRIPASRRLVDGMHDHRARVTIELALLSAGEELAHPVDASPLGAGCRLRRPPATVQRTP